MNDIKNTMTPEEEKKALAEIRADVEAHPELYAAKDDGTFDWNDLGVGGYAALNTAGFGIPDVILKAADTDLYKDIQRKRAQNKGADIIGTTIGALAPTEGGLIKGASKLVGLGAKGLQGAKALKAAEVASKVAKGLDTAGDIARGTKEVSGLAKNIGKGALIAGEQIAPTAIAGQASPQEMLLALGLGGGIGGAFHGLGTVVKNLPEKIEDTKKWADKTIMKRANINDKVMRAQKAFMGDDISKYYSELADFSEERNLHRGPELDKLRKEVRETWKNLSKNFDKDKDFALDVQKIVKADDVAQAINRDIDTMSKLDNIVSKTNDTVGFGNKREYLNEILYNDKFDIDDKKIARQIINQIEEHAEDLSGLGMGKAKHDWRIMKPFEAADILDDMKVAKGGLAGGSDTVFKLGLAGAAGGTGVSGLNDVKNDPSDPKAWAKLLGAGVLGGSYGIVRETLGVALAKTVRGMPTDKISKIIESIVSGKIPQVIAKNLPKGLEKSIAAELVREDPEETIAKDILANQGTIPSVEKADLTEGKFFNKSKEVTPDVYDNFGNIEASKGAPSLEYNKFAETEIQPQVSEETDSIPSEAIDTTNEAKQYSDAYYSKLDEAMKQYWIKNFSDQMNYQDYVNEVAKQTDNFNPEKTISFLVPNKEERTKVLKQLNVAKDIKDLDIGEMYNKGKFLDNILDPESVKQRKFNQNKLVQTIASLITKEGDIPTKSDYEQINNDIKFITELSATSDEKKQLLVNLLKDKYGLDYNSLTNLGLV